jgi:hypothetical protein
MNSRRLTGLSPKAKITTDYSSFRVGLGYIAKEPVTAGGQKALFWDISEPVRVFSGKQTISGHDRTSREVRNPTCAKCGGRMARNSIAFIQLPHRRINSPCDVSDGDSRDL